MGLFLKKHIRLSFTARSAFISYRSNLIYTIFFITLLQLCRYLFLIAPTHTHFLI